MYCQFCGREIREGQRFCPGCGHNLEKKADARPDRRADRRPDVKSQDDFLIKLIVIAGAVLLTVGLAVAVFIALKNNSDDHKDEPKNPVSEEMDRDETYIKKEDAHAEPATAPETVEAAPAEELPEETEEPAPAAEPPRDPHEPFYGVWVSAGKSLENAQELADELTSRGFQGEVFISSDWSNLNPETWYVISASACPTRSEGEAVLEAVKSAGYSDAYVKYTGDYIGD